MCSVYDESLNLHKKLKGKIEVSLKQDLQDRSELSLFYTPGVAQPCIEISNNKENVYEYTWKGNTVAVVSDGSAVLGLGNIGADAALPVMEGKCYLFKKFADIDAVPICLDTQDSEKIVEIVKAISTNFGGINLEDISAPRCISIERRLKEELDIPVFHDDQHGTAIVVTAGLINALSLANKKPEDCVVTISGTGAAGSAIIKMLNQLNISNIYAFNKDGLLNYKKKDSYNFLDLELSQITNLEQEDLTLKDALCKSDVFIGVSVGNLLTAQDIKLMNEKAIVFALANPEPEISYKEAIDGGAFVVGTGRSDYPNQINNVLVFPGIFKGALMYRKKITDEVKLQVAIALANCVDKSELSRTKIIPDVMDEKVVNEIVKVFASND